MKLKLERIFTNNDYTIGHLYIINDNNEKKFICDTIEDTDRLLSADMCEAEIEKKKVHGKTAIPSGTYKLTLSVKSPKYSNFEKYKWAKKYDGKLPRFLDVKGYEGVLIHVGNTAQDTEGCILVGYNKVKGKVINSTAAFSDLMDNYLTKANDDIYIEISRKY